MDTRNSAAAQHFFETSLRPCKRQRHKKESVISYADYAVAMIDEALNGNHIQQRISVVAK